jgi:hypothetical protein
MTLVRHHIMTPTLAIHRPPLPHVLIRRPRHLPLIPTRTGTNVESVTTPVRHHVMTPTLAIHKPPLPHVLILLPLRKVVMQPIRDILWTEKLLALRQVVLMLHRLKASKLLPQHHLVNSTAQRMTRVFNPAPMYTSKEME